MMALQGMVKSLPWNEMGMEIVGTARDGTSGLALARRYRPDIVITDIRMPGMDGLELIREVLAIRPETIFIILSGYSEFQYAKKAIAYGVMGYLEKPVDVAELKEILKKACDILKSRKQQESNSQLQSRHERSELLKKAVHGRMDDTDVPGLLGISREELRHYTVAVCGAAGDIILTERSFYWAESWLRESGRWQSGCYVFWDNGHIVLLIPQAERGRDLERLVEQFRRAMSSKGCATLKIGICQSEDASGDLTLAYQNALYALRFCVFYGCGPALLFGAGLKEKTMDLWEYKESAQICAAKGETEQLLELIRGALDAMNENRIGLESFVHECMELLYCCVDAMDTLQRTKVKKGILEKENPFSMISGFAHFAKARTYLIEIMIRIMEVWHQEENREYHYKIAKAQDYILKHYSESITLQQLAELVDISPTYFSVLFKKTVGVSYLQYLTGSPDGTGKAPADGGRKGR